MYNDRSLDLPPVLHCPQKNSFWPIVQSVKCLKAPLLPFFSSPIFRFSALAQKISTDPIGRYGLLGAPPWRWQSRSSFRALLPVGPRRWNLKIGKKYGSRRLNVIFLYWSQVYFWLLSKNIIVSYSHVPVSLRFFSETFFFKWYWVGLSPAAEA